MTDPNAEFERNLMRVIVKRRNRDIEFWRDILRNRVGCHLASGPPRAVMLGAPRKKYEWKEAIDSAWELLGSPRPRLCSLRNAANRLWRIEWEE